MLEFLQLDTSLLHKHFGAWLCADHGKTSLLQFHGERPVVLDGLKYCYTQDRERKCRRHVRTLDHWKPPGNYHQVLPRRNGVAYAINAKYQVVRLCDTQEYPIPTMTNIAWIGQYKDGLYTLNGEGMLMQWTFKDKKWDVVRVLVGDYTDFAVSYWLFVVAKLSTFDPVMTTSGCRCWVSREKCYFHPTRGSMSILSSTLTHG